MCDIGWEGPDIVFVRIKFWGKHGTDITRIVFPILLPFFKSMTCVLFLLYIDLILFVNE